MVFSKDYSPVEFHFQNSNIINPQEILILPELSVKQGRFLFSSSPPDCDGINLQDYYIYPGLINSHDHLLGTYLPKVGRGPYLSWKPWDIDLKAADIYRERNLLSNSQIYEVSYYRQILSGVTTVCDHIPHVIHENQIEQSLIRIIEQYCLAHEISSYELEWGDPHEVEIERAKKKNIPFITHLEEGFDEESMRGVEMLDRMKGIFRNSVLVHCIGCSISDVKLIAQKQASMVWCPNSNFYMFNQTAKIRDFLLAGVNVCLGTDSPMSGSLNLLEEMRFAQQSYQKVYGEKLEPSELFKMVTINGAKAFLLDHDLGSISTGKKADFVVIKKKNSDPYQQLLETHPQDIELVVREGIPLLWTDVSAKWISNFPAHQEVKLEPHPNSSSKTSATKYLIGNPLLLLKAIEKKLGFEKKLDFLPFV